MPSADGDRPCAWSAGFVSVRLRPAGPAGSGGLRRQPVAQLEEVRILIRELDEVRAQTEGDRQERTRPIESSRHRMRATVDSAYVYGGSISFRDITQGNNGASCLVGFDLCSGRGSWTGPTP
ncbi:MAG: hypothetical protein ACXWMN_07980 [Candidatus Limnocylindria bacterium]